MNLRKTNGFTLIEVLVGLVILAVGLLAIAGHFLCRSAVIMLNYRDFG
jgi:prepilin-type N-terminal cleavage/methylation domain-containing protein